MEPRLGAEEEEAHPTGDQPGVLASAEELELALPSSSVAVEAFDSEAFDSRHLIRH